MAPPSQELEPPAIPGRFIPTARRCVGDFVVFYEPSTLDEARRIKGGRTAYFGTARVTDVIPDPEVSGWWRALIDSASYVDFERPVPLKGAGGYFERDMESPRGGASRGKTGVSVRNLEDSQYEAILAAGFHESLLAEAEQPDDPLSRKYEIDDIPASFERPIVQRLVSRPVRDRAFATAVQDAYGATCAITGIKVINGGGRAEIEAAHIKSVEDKGPDTVRNGLALSRTFHWLFDRGLIGVSDDYQILVAEKYVDPRLQGLIHPNRKLVLPTDRGTHPHPQFLRHHREKFREKLGL